MIPKFRAYHKEKGYFGPVRFIDLVDSIVQFKAKDYIVSDKLDRVVLMQSTGLIDKNGVEIYEGDIIQVSDKSKSINFVVSKSKCDFVLIRDDFEELLSETISELKSESEYNYNVIGNIYENPELVEGDEDE